MNNKKEKDLVVIFKEEAIFWLDKKGNWRNENGPFQNPKINAHFHSSIQRDEEDCYLFQEHGEYLEKVYFPYEDTALFVSEVLLEAEPVLILNNHERIPLVPENLFAKDDQLYTLDKGHRIKFTENALLRISNLMLFQDDHIFININGEKYRIYSY